MVNSEVVEEDLLYGYARDEPLLRFTRISPVLHIQGCCVKPSEPGASYRIGASSLTKAPFGELHMRISKQPCAREERIVGGGAAPHGRPQVVQENLVGRAGERGTTWPGEKKKEWTDCEAEDRRASGITKNGSTTALDPGAWPSTVLEGSCRFMTA